MGIMRRLFSVGTGLAAGLLAYKLINRYEKKVQLEGEYRVIAPEEEEAGPQEAAAEEQEEAPQAAEEAPAEQVPAREEEPRESAGPNPNPVLRPEPSEVTGPDGRIDPTKVAEASDFADWDEMGCKS